MHASFRKRVFVCVYTSVSGYDFFCQNAFMWPASAGKEPVTPANQQNYAREDLAARSTAA